MESEMTTCMDCGASQRVQKDQTVAYDFGGLPHVALKGIDVRVCENGHREYVIPAVEGLHSLIAHTLALKPSRLASDEIRFMRKFLGYSQADFAPRMGVAPESVNRWESGAIQMAAPAERLLRLAVLMLDPVSNYKTLDLFAKLTEKREPARMALRRKANEWVAMKG
jgi:putative zinc finger/helix-turn-helix YgiT family protein